MKLAVMTVMGLAAHFSSTGRFSKLPYFAMKFGHWQEFKKLHMYPDYELIFALQAIVLPRWSTFSPYSG